MVEVTHKLSSERNKTAKNLHFVHCCRSTMAIHFLKKVVGHKKHFCMEKILSFAV